MTDHETRRLSFGSVAANYDRYRPGPPPQALDWLIPAGAQAVLDLAAGTGTVTRELAGRGERVIAVEPDERMRAILTASCPWAEVLAGRGEDIPLRTRRWTPGHLGRLALAGSGPCRAVPCAASGRGAGRDVGRPRRRVPWIAELNQLARPARAADGQRGGRPGGRRRREVAFPPGTLMSAAEQRTVEYSVPMTKDDLLGMLGTYSGVITLEPEVRAGSSAGFGTGSTASRGSRPTCR